MEKLVANAVIQSNEAIIPEVFKMVLLVPEIAKTVQPGQFVEVRKPKSTTFLRRPFSVAGADPLAGTLTLIYRKVGKGTEEMVDMRDGEILSVEGPLGKGFSLEPGRILLVGGGVGVAPLVFLAHRLVEKPMVLIGGKTANETFWTKFLEPYAEHIYITTDDGSLGRKGFAVQALPDIFAENKIDRIATCGPTVMMKSIAEAAEKANIDCEVSMEKHMACGIGVCLGCTFEGKLTGRRRKVCSEGPVFPAKEVF